MGERRLMTASKKGVAASKLQWWLREVAEFGTPKPETFL
jgi:hypothetical protein